MQFQCIFVLFGVEDLNISHPDEKFAERDCVGDVIVGIPGYNESGSKVFYYRSRKLYRFLMVEYTPYLIVVATVE